LKKKQKEKIELNGQQVESLIMNIEACDLSSENKKNIKYILECYFWLQTKLQESNITIKRIMSMFGFQKTESLKNLSTQLSSSSQSENNEENSSKEESALSEDPSKTDDSKDSDTVKKKTKGHGRLGHEAYTGASVENHAHESLKHKDSCPYECGGKVYFVEPSIVVCLTGHSPLSATKHVLERLRCNLCGEVFTASPKNITLRRYDEKAKAVLAIAKTYIAVPMKRMETWQQMVGIPMKDASQWDIIESLANDVYPIYKTLYYLAAQGNLIRHDDTKVRILSLIKENKLFKENERKGMFTTGILSEYEGHQISLFLSGRKHSGENMEDLLSKRSAEAKKLTRMCDALSSNLSRSFIENLCNCLAHGRRKFFDLHTFFIEESLTVLEALGKVYQNDAFTKEEKMSDQERLEYHQKHSAPVMENLKVWFDKQIDDKIVEPNSSLGKAIKYMQNHWKGLTCFLRIPGAPLDNNKVEGLLKIIIRGRKNSLFYKTEISAFIGSMMTSIIQTCVMAGENPFEYLVVLQKNRSALFKNPEAWLPWNYKETLQIVAQKSQSPPTLVA